MMAVAGKIIKAGRRNAKLLADTHDLINENNWLAKEMAFDY